MRKNKKGFTIVELVIVIAVIAVLAAVLVPTFIHLSNKAQEASDNSLVNTLNTHLRIQEAENGKDARNMSEAVQYLKKEGIYASQLVTKSEHDLVYSIDDHQFYLSNDEKIDQDNKHKYFHIYDSVPETQTWSIYASDEWATAEVGDLTVGFDAGETNKVVSSLNFKGTTNDNKEAVIVTNWEDTTFTVNATDGVIYHYGLAGSVDVIKCGMASFHARGEIGFAKLDDGRIVADTGGKVVNVLQVSATAKVDTNGGEIGDVYGKDGDCDEKNGNVDVHPYEAGQPNEQDLIDEGKSEVTPPGPAIEVTQSNYTTVFTKNGNYVVTENILHATAPFIIPEGLTVTLDLNGYNISCEYDEEDVEMAYAVQSGEFIVNVSTVTNYGTLTLVGEGTVGGPGGWFGLVNYGDLTLDGPTIKGGTIYFKEYGVTFYAGAYANSGTMVAEGYASSGPSSNVFSRP